MNYNSLLVMCIIGLGVTLCSDEVWSQQNDDCSVVVSGEVFCDDFSDGNYFDGDPVRWVTTNSITVRDESLVIGAQNVAYADVNGVFLTDTSLRTQAFLTEGNAIGISIREVNNAMSYSGFVDVVNNEAGIGFGGDGVSDDDAFLETVPFTFDAATQDVMLQLDAMGSEISLWAWHPDDAMPNDPLLTVTDESLERGEIFVWVANYDVEIDVGLGPTSGEFRFVQLSETHIPEPSSFLLFGLAIGSLILSRKPVRRPCDS